MQAAHEMPGPGDSSTWGPVVDPRDPRWPGNDALVELAHGVLATEYLAAAQTDPRKNISTPGFADLIGGWSQTPMIDVLADQLAGVGSEALWTEMVGALTKSAAGITFLRKLAESYATFHEMDEAGVKA